MIVSISSLTVTSTANLIVTGSDGAMLSISNALFTLSPVPPVGTTLSEVRGLLYPAASANHSNRILPRTATDIVP